MDVPENGKLSPDLIGLINEKLTNKKYRDKAHIAALHKNLIVLKKKKFVKLDLADDEIQTNKIGASTRSFIKAFQKKYKLTETGKMDAATDERLESVVTSIAGSKPQPKKLLKTKKPSELTRTVHYLRLNMKSEKVQKLQKNLAWLGYKAHNEEFTSQVYGKTTREAVKKFQTDHILPITGRVDSATAKALNAELAKTNPQFIRCDRYRIRGSVRDELWKGKGRVTVQIYEKRLRGNDILMGEQKTFKNGFYDILYQPPLDSVTKKPKSPLHVIVKIVDDAGGEIDSKTYYKVNKVHWVNFTEGTDCYLGPSEFEQRMKALAPRLEAANLKIEDLEQSDTKEDIILLYQETGMLPEDIIRLSLAHRIANEVNKKASLPAALFYAFLRQNLPPETPSDLFPDEPNEWAEWIPRLVLTLINGLVFLEADVQQAALDNAFQHNFLPRALKPKKEKIIQALNSLREDYVLTKPLLVGDGNLKALLGTSMVSDAHFSIIAQTFVKHQGVSKAFWGDLEDGGTVSPAVLRDLKTTVDLGIIAKNHIPTVQLLKAKIDDPSQPKFRGSRDFAKLTENEWVSRRGSRQEHRTWLVACLRLIPIHG
jgi:peptidoglycan hydrolase-like protein with peptidoglycan-binding domain